MSRRRPIEPDDIMDAAEVATHLGVSASALRVAISAPHRFPGLARRLPAPLRRVTSTPGAANGAPIWRRADIEAASD